jgi:4-amino-4-deoxy-L-arabinose transferase-like glycosyltransferase
MAGQSRPRSKSGFVIGQQPAVLLPSALLLDSNLGTSDFALRSLSVFCSLACFPFIVSLARRTGGAKSVGPVCVLFPLAPLLFYYSTEARMYPLLLLTLLATALATLRLQEKGGSLSGNLVWIGSSAAGLLTHYFFFFPWAGMVIFLLLRPGKLSRRDILLFPLAVSLIILPWYAAAFLYQHHLPSSGKWFKYRLPDYDLTGAARDQVLQSFSASGYGIWGSEAEWSYASLSLFACVFLVALFHRGLRLFQGPRLLLWLWFVGAALAPTALDFVNGTYLSHHPRYALGAAPAAYLLAGFCLTSLAKARVALLLLIVCSWSGSIRSIWRQDARIGEPYRRLTKAMALTGAKDEAVIVDSIPSGVLGFARYANRATKVTSWVEPLGTRKIPDSLIAFSRGYRRILLVNTHGFHSSEPVETWLREHFDAVSKRSMDGLQVVDFQFKAETFEHASLGRDDQDNY